MNLETFYLRVWYSKRTIHGKSLIDATSPPTILSSADTPHASSFGNKGFCSPTVEVRSQITFYSISKHLNKILRCILCYVRDHYAELQILPGAISGMSTSGISDDDSVGVSMWQHTLAVKPSKPHPDRLTYCRSSLVGGWFFNSSIRAGHLSSNTQTPWVFFGVVQKSSIKIFSY